MMPILFGLIGNAMRFNTLQKNSIAKACGIIFAGLFSPTLSMLCKRQRVVMWAPRGHVYVLQSYMNGSIS